MPQQDYITRFSEPETVAAGGQPGPRARNRRERLALALAHLERAGITGANAYAPAFHALTRIGLIVKPLHYRSLPGLTLFGFVLLSALLGGAVALSKMIGVTPGPVRAILEVGPAGFFAVNGLLGLGFAAIIRFQAIGARLPSWRDL